MGLLNALINKSWLAGRGLKDLIDEGYPESVAKRIVSGELDMREPARSAREKAFGTPSFHSTRTSWNEVDPDAVDIGLHSGTTEQADMRLRDTATDYKFAGRGRDPKDFPYGDGAQVMPLVIKSENPLDMNDVGQWENAQAVAESLLFHPKFRNEKGRLEDIYSEMDDVLLDAGGDYDRYIDIPDNRRLLDELRGMIADKGYDSVKYENTVENAFGSSSNLKPEMQAQSDLLNKQIKELQRIADSSPDRPKLPSQADLRDMTPEEVTQAISAYTDWSPPKSDEIEALKAKLMAISDNPSNFMDTHSYVSIKPENVRSKYAAFDPEYTGSNILGSRMTPTTASLLNALTAEDITDLNQQVAIDSGMAQIGYDKGNPESAMYNYGDILPIKRHKDTGEYSPAMTGILEEIMRGLLDVGESRKTGRIQNANSLWDVIL